MAKLIEDAWVFRCGKCNHMMSLPGIIPGIEMLKKQELKYCPCCGEEIEYPKEETGP